VPEDLKDIALAESIGKDLVLQELIAKETLLLAVSSSTFQNLPNHVTKNLLPKTQLFIPTAEMPLLCFSDGKVNAIEDCIMFFPSLFKLNKSIVLSETLEPESPKAVVSKELLFNTSADEEEEQDF
jgi:hypothetical protein